MVAVPEAQEKSPGKEPMLVQPLCLVFHPEHSLRAPLAVVGRTPLLAVCAPELDTVINC